MQDTKRKIDKLKALIIKEQRLLLDVIATTARADQKGVTLTADSPDFWGYNTLLAEQLQLLSRLMNKQTKKQNIIATCQEENAKNSIHIDNLEVKQDYLQDELFRHNQPTLDDSVDEHEVGLEDENRTQSDSNVGQAQSLEQSQPNIR